MVQSRVVQACVVVASLIGGCRTHSPPPLLVRTIADTVRLDSVHGSAVALVRVQLGNPSSDTITAGYCGEALQQRQNDVWKTVQVQLCAGPAPSWKVLPGDSLLIAYRIDDYLGMQTLTRRGPLLEGHYRLHYQGTYGSRSVLVSFYSAPFVIVRPSAPSNTR